MSVLAGQAQFGKPVRSVRVRDMPQHRDGSGVARGSRGGPPIWTMREAWMPDRCTCRETGWQTCRRHSGTRQLSVLMGREPARPDRPAGDPDGFAVFGRFPRGWLRDVCRFRLLGDAARHEILHVCSGALSTTERWTVDIRPEARPAIVADGCRLPFRDCAWKAVLIDPPYSEEYGRALYGTAMPRPRWLLAEAARVVKPGGRIGILHVAVPFAPPGCRLVNVYGVTTGVGYRIRAFTVYERVTAGLLLDRPDGERAREEGA
jgi:hypothetical protein